MKLNTPKEIADKKQAEIARDITRTKEVKDELARITKELEDAEAKFKFALANQRVRWAQEEAAAVKKIEDARTELSVVEKCKSETLIPIVEREEKSYALFTQAELAYKDADEKRAQAEEGLKRQEELNVLFEEKIDSLTDREENVTKRELAVSAREKTQEDERLLIKNLSAELSIKLTNIK